MGVKEVRLFGWSGDEKSQGRSKRSPASVNREEAGVIYPLDIETERKQ